MAIIRQHGFDIGSAVGIQKATDVWTITGIDGKKIQLAAGDARTAVEVAAFVKTWSLKDPKSVEEVHPAWPESRVIQTKVAQTMIVKGQILAAVGHLASAVDLNFKHPACLTVYSKPVRAVKMNSNVPVGGLVLSPDSVNVKVTSDLSSFDASAAVRVTVEPNPLPDQYDFLAAATATDMMSPLWCVQTTTEEGDANMTWSKYEVQSVTGFDYIGRPNPAKLQGKSVIKGKSSLPAGDVEQQGISTIVSIPLLINRRALKKGESLLVFKAPPAKRPREVEPITVAKLAKKALTASSWCF